MYFMVNKALTAWFFIWDGIITKFLTKVVLPIATLWFFSGVTIGVILSIIFFSLLPLIICTILCGICFATILLIEEFTY